MNGEKAERQVIVRAWERSPVLIVMAGARACAIPLDYVAETMRPLPIEPVAGTPGFVRGVSVIRGAPTPVVDLKGKGQVKTWFLGYRSADIIIMTAARRGSAK